MPRELYLLSPYQAPSQHPLLLGEDDVAAFLNGYAVLWHPAALREASGPPRVASPYDHEHPAAGRIFAVPETSPSLQPDDWDQRVREAGAVAFRSSADRSVTLARLLDAMAGAALTDVPMERVRAFMGLGFGYLMLNALYEAMEHENLLSVADFWQEIQDAVAAVADSESDRYRHGLQAAADRLLAAREVLYPVAIHIIDIATADRVLSETFECSLPVNVVAAACELVQWGQQHPERLAKLGELVRRDSAEVCGGCYLEREDELLPIESQQWNLDKGLAAYREALGAEVRVFARRRYAFHPLAPLFLANAGISKALGTSIEDTKSLGYHSTVVAFTAADGRQIDTFARAPYPAEQANTFFHLAHYLHKTIMQDHVATIALVAGDGAIPPSCGDWQELSRFAPVLGQRTTLSRYLGDVTAGEYASTMSPDEYHADHLVRRVEAGSERPVSFFAARARQRRRIETMWTLSAFVRGLLGTDDSLRVEDRAAELEDEIEGATGAPSGASPEWSALEENVGATVAERLLARATETERGYLLLNPCSFPRRIALELPVAGPPVPVAGPVKACQVDADAMRLVVEAPGLGFAWFPRSGPAGQPPMAERMRLADDRHVRNEFFEAEIDVATGGLRGLRDHQTQVHRLGQQLVFHPGSTMKATDIRVVSRGPALGEVVTEGTLTGEQDQVLAKYRQRYRAWLGRPVLEIRVEIEPALGPAGYAWHAYYAARFAWRDERALLMRGLNGTGYVTSHPRPETPDYLELRQGRQNTVIFPCGLPFHQRYGSRMLDVILIPPGETARSLDLGVSLDREHPMLTAQGIITPTPCLEVVNGPPHVGASGWLFHVDSPNLLLTSLRPGRDGKASVAARLLECGQHGGQAEMRFPRHPSRAEVQDLRGGRLREAHIDGDRAGFEVAPGELFQLYVEF
jgi:hypothetical protein